MANASRNAQAGFDRRRRWAPARDALWEFLAPHLDDGARVAILGAGNGDDLPLRRIARRAGAVDLIDIDPGAARGARQRLARAERRKVTVIGEDVTGGGADRI
ncbi:MAG TPA: class I SAM-dependent methyltransferase, partial [Solirubrobacterales bacterium]